MSIKRISRKRTCQSSNLTIRMVYDRMMFDRMGPDKMSDLRGPGGIAGGAQNNLPQRSEHVNQANSSEKK